MAPAGTRKKRGHRYGVSSVNTSARPVRDRDQPGTTMQPLRPIVVLVVLALAGAAAALPMSDQQAVEKDLMAMRDALRDAMKAKDAIKLRTMYADGFSHIDGTGALVNREAHLTALLIGEAMIEDAGIGEWRLRLHGRDIAVLTGRSTLTAKADGRTYDVRWTQVFVRELGVWRIAASQITRLPETPGARR